MRKYLREEVMYQRKAYEMSELLIDVVFEAVDENDKLQSLLEEMESYLTPNEISKSDCKVEMKDVSVKTSSDIELEKEKSEAISKMVDELEDALERRKELLLDEMESYSILTQPEVFKGDCKVEMKAGSVKTSSRVEVGTENGDAISKMIDELEEELERQQDPELDRNAEKFRTEEVFETLNMRKETDGVYCNLFGGSDDVDYRPIIIKNRQTETYNYHLRQVPLIKFYNLFYCNHSKTVLKTNHIEHANGVNNFDANKQERPLTDKTKSSRRSFRERLLAFFCCGKTNE